MGRSEDISVRDIPSEEGRRPYTIQPLEDRGADGFCVEFTTEPKKAVTEARVIECADRNISTC